MLKRIPCLQRITIASGSYIVNKGKSAILEAYLGTCVGVALCDRHANVGGLIHLRLPEPTAMNTPWQPAMYAATGLPLLIQQLRKEGASSETMEASVAGGALVGPLSRRDLILDIGGRTAEVVERILHQEKITLRRSEIGGFFSCRLSLNLQTWDIDIDPVGISEDSPGGSDFERPDVERLDHIIDRVRPIPQIALKVVRLISDHTHHVGEVAQEVKRDQVISAKVIGFCNSASIGMAKRVDSIERALLIVGEKCLLQLIVAAGLEGFLSQTEAGYSLCKGGLFQHACGTARVAGSLAQLTGQAPPDLAYTAGLLHDIGKVVLDQYMVAARPHFYRCVQAADVDLIRAESELFGVTHTEVGSRLAARWSIPATLTDAIQHHHLPEQAVIAPELTHLVYLADLIMSRFRVGQELEKLNTDRLASRLRRIGLTLEQFPILIEKISHEITDFPWPGSSQ